jgi:hypothetical protein
MKTNKQQYTNNLKQQKKATENYSTRRDDHVDIKNAKNGAKMTKLWLKQFL